jgi:hypothetical protein
VIKNDRFILRELSAGDDKTMSAFRVNDRLKIMELFEHKYERGAYNPSRIIGLFEDKKLLGCVIPVFEETRGIKISDLSGPFILKAYDTKENRRALISHAIDLALKAGFLPTIAGTPDLNGESAEMGYTLVSKRYAFVRGDSGSGE